MAYPHRVARVTLSGDCFGGAEIWSTGFYMGFEDSDAPAPTEQGVADIAAAWQTYFSAPTSYVSNKYRFKMAKLQTMAVDGKAVADSAVYFQPATPVPGASSGQAMPPQTALVATLANSLPRGLATKGRMFLPGVNAGVDDTGHLLASVPEGISTNLQTFFNTIYQDADTPGNPILVSLGNSLQLRPGAARYVTQIRVGNVYDTQRRRRNALVESYTVKPVSVG